MQTNQTVLLLGATGRTGSRVLEQLRARDVRVRAIVRSPHKLPGGSSDDERLEVVEADLLSLSADDLARHVAGCAAVISCLGHVADLAGIFGAPRDLVTQAVARVSDTIRMLQPATPVRFVLMSSVTVNDPGGRREERRLVERATLAVLRGLLPPAKDNQCAADTLYRLGPDSAVEWVAVRPDTLIEGDVSEYSVDACLVNSLFRPGESRMSNVAHFMCELVTDDAAWNRWRGTLPTIVDG